MCGIIITTSDISAKNIGRKLETRGPDCKSCQNIKGVTFIHYLLHMTGEHTTQPFVEGDIVAIFNGEIYNYKDLNIDAKSDGESIIPTYKKFGVECISKFDGEFAMVIFDFSKSILIVSSDVFRTKPLFYNISPESIIISSYLSVCKEIDSGKIYSIVNPNQTVVFDFDTRLVIQTLPVYTFDLRQYKTSLNDWNAAFENAVLKRYSSDIRPLIFLSSGLDSGAIACCLHKHSKDFLAMSICKNEDMQVLNARKSIYGDKHVFLDYSSDDRLKSMTFLEKYCEDHIHKWEVTPSMHMFNDGANGAKIKMMHCARQIIPKSRLSLSGIGADEIMNTHRCYDMGNRGQVDEFPQDLSSVFPWRNFYEGSMRNYILSDEYVAGSIGYETRYPFLDKALVQEFLNLIPDLKNHYPKHAIIEYVRLNNHPYTIRKMGFNVS
jgi:asparagine synthase (glutamine-hydrolysing)